MRGFEMGAIALVVAGSVVAVMDSISGQSLDLWAVNATSLLAITAGVSLLTLSNFKPASKDTGVDGFDSGRDPRNRIPNLLRGARAGYTKNRREIAQILRSAVEAKLALPTGAPPREAVDAYISGAIGPSRFSELFSEDRWRYARVEASSSYVAHLEEALASLRQALGLS